MVVYCIILYNIMYYRIIARSYPTRVTQTSSHVCYKNTCRWCHWRGHLACGCCPSSCKFGASYGFVTCIFYFGRFISSFHLSFHAFFHVFPPWLTDHGCSLTRTQGSELEECCALPCFLLSSYKLLSKDILPTIDQQSCAYKCCPVLLPHCETKVLLLLPK